MQRSALCRSRRELSNEYLLAKICVDTAENEPLEVCGKIIQYYSFVSLVACEREGLVQAAEVVAEFREALAGPGRVGAFGEPYRFSFPRQIRIGISGKRFVFTGKYFLVLRTARSRLYRNRCLHVNTYIESFFRPPWFEYLRAVPDLIVEENNVCNTL